MDGERDVMQAGTPVDQRDQIKHVTLPGKEDAHQRIARSSTRGGVLRDPEAELRIEGGVCTRIGHVDLSVINPGRCGASEVSEVQRSTRPGRHRHAQLDRHPADVGRVQSTTLVRSVGPVGGQAALLEVNPGGVKVIFGRHAEPESLRVRVFAAAEYHTVVGAFLYPAKVSDILVGLGDDQPNQARVEVHTPLEVGD
jgi:hypothetical protein